MDGIRIARFTPRALLRMETSGGGGGEQFERQFNFSEYYKINIWRTRRVSSSPGCFGSGRQAGGYKREYFSASLRRWQPVPFRRPGPFGVPFRSRRQTHSAQKIVCCRALNDDDDDFLGGEFEEGNVFHRIVLFCLVFSGELRNCVYNVRDFVGDF